MTIELSPEQERLVENLIKSGQFRDVDQFLAEAFAALLAKGEVTHEKPALAKDMDALFEPVRGLFSDGELDFSRSPSTDRPLEL